MARDLGDEEKPSKAPVNLLPAMVGLVTPFLVIITLGRIPVTTFTPNLAGIWGKLHARLRDSSGISFHASTHTFRRTFC